MSSQGNDATLTLSIGGVDFCLAPGPAAAAENMISVSKIMNGEVLINLNNFVGTLRVKNGGKDGAMEHSAEATALPEATTESNDDGNLHDDRSIDASSVAMTPNPVEDTPSPQSKESAGEDEPADKASRQRKGQQTLNFFGKRGKKQGQVRASLTYHMS